MKKRGFTLIEMLIVIVIIGILAGALIPRIGSARDKANDTARKANLQGVATALLQYSVSNNRLPVSGLTQGNCTGMQNIGNELAEFQYTQQLLPKDPAGVGVSYGTTGLQTNNSGDYLYCKLDGSHFVLVSTLSTSGNVSDLAIMTGSKTYGDVSALITAEGEGKPFYMYIQ